MKLNTIGQLFAGSWKRFSERFWVTVAIFAPAAVLLTLCQLLFHRRTAPAVLLGFLLYIVGFIAAIIASLGLISAYGNNTDFGHSYETGVRLFWHGIWVAIILWVVLLGGFIMLVIPGIMLLVQLVFANYTLVLEGKRGLGALSQSREYVKGFWWAVFGRMVLLMLVVWVAAIIILAPLSVLLGATAALILYGIFIVIVTPYAAAYQYEIFHNLRQLKPHLAQETPKNESSFLKVSIVVGIIGIVVIPILIFSAVAFLGSRFISQWQSQNPNGYQWGWISSSTAMIAPDNGPVGTSVMISGLDPNELGATETVLINKLVAARNVPVAGDGSLTFTIPANMAPDCQPTQACPQFLAVTSPNTYEISLEQDAGDPNPIDVGAFTVTASGLY